MRIQLLFILAVSLLVPLASLAQEAPADSQPDPGLEAMAKLAHLAGTWEGTGWMRRGPGEPHHTLSRETVESRLGGRILVVEGLHHAKEDPAHVVHHAFGVISYDPEKSQYRFRTYLVNGQEGDHEMRLEGDAILWFIDTPRGKIRYTIRIQEGKWNERGEFSADGETWQEFFGMDLKATS